MKTGGLASRFVWKLWQSSGAALAGRHHAGLLTAGAALLASKPRRGARKRHMVVKGQFLRKGLLLSLTVLLAACSSRYD